MSSKGKQDVSADTERGLEGDAEVVFAPPPPYEFHSSGELLASTSIVNGNRFSSFNNWKCPTNPALQLMEPSTSTSRHLRQIR
jgi:hypothetical protein